MDARLGVRITPHSVGLQDTDLAYRDDMSREAGMVLITRTGFELLNEPGEELIVV